jgi:hypothetical protein
VHCSNAPYYRVVVLLERALIKSSRGPFPGRASAEAPKNFEVMETSYVGEKATKAEKWFVELDEASDGIYIPTMKNVKLDM